MIVPRAHREDFGELYQPLIRNLIARQIELFQADGRALDLDHQRQQGRDLSPQLASCTETSDGESRSTAERPRSTAERPCSPACSAAGVAEVSTMRRSERRCSVGCPAMPAQSCCNHSALTYDLPSPISRAVARVSIEGGGRRVRASRCDAAHPDASARSVPAAAGRAARRPCRRPRRASLRPTRATTLDRGTRAATRAAACLAYHSRTAHTCSASDSLRGSWLGRHPRAIGMHRPRLVRSRQRKWRGTRRTQQLRNTPRGAQHGAAAQGEG